MENFGKKCQQQSCRQLDFLPIECRYCQQKFCDQHARTEQHNCEAYKKEKDKRQVSESKEKKNRCNINGCRTVLTLTNVYDCQKCGKKTCMACRYPEKHDCTSLKQNQKQNGAQAKDPKFKKIQDQQKEQKKKKRGFFFCCGGKPQKKANK